MTRVKESKKTRMVVVPHDPRRKYIVSAIVLVLVALSYFAGSYLANEDYTAVREQRDRLLSELSEVNRQNKDQQKMLAQQNIDASVDRQATNQVRESMASLRQEIADLNSEISFYRGLMSPSDRDKGVSIRSLDILATANPRQFSFKMVLQQFASEHRLVTGNVIVNIVGKRGGKDLIYALSDLSEEVKAAKIKYRFKYYQNIAGDIILPSGFEPQGIEVVVKGSGKKPVRIEKKFGWVTQEA